MKKIERREVAQNAGAEEERISVDNLYNNIYKMIESISEKLVDDFITGRDQVVENVRIPNEMSGWHAPIKVDGSNREDHNILSRIKEEIGVDVRRINISHTRNHSDTVEITVYFKDTSTEFKSGIKYVLSRDGMV